MVHLESSMDQVATFIDDQIESAGQSIKVTDINEDFADSDDVNQVKDTEQENDVITEEDAIVAEDVPETDTYDTEPEDDVSLAEDTTTGMQETTVSEPKEKTIADSQEETTADLQEEVAIVSDETVYQVYIVQQGDTLADISRRYYRDLSMINTICELNNIEDGNTIFYGQKILLP